MNVRASTLPSARDTLARIANGLRMVTVPLPHLAGLAAAVRVDLDERVPTMGVFASGRLIANPAFVARLKQNELVFVLAHELLHLALRTHDRARGSGRIEFNYAHDYIINDILRVELGFASIPAGGLDMPGARTRSAEEIVLEMRRNADLMPSRSRVFEGETVTLRRVIGGVPGAGQRREALAPDSEAGDVLDEARERDMFPAEAADQAARASAIGELAARSAARTPARPRMSFRRCAAFTARRGRWRCRSGWNPSRRASARSCGPRAVAPTAATWCCPGASANPGCSMSCSTPQAR
jgi:hypothetical protein